MKLALKDLKWHDDVAALARRLGWTVYEQGSQQQRQEDPSFVAVKGGTVIVVWLRSAAVRPSRMPPVDRFSGAAVAGYCWSPADMAKARMVLMSVAVAPGGQPDDAA
ncbi:hypothetical protein [Streptomyces lincolnensis]|uniref:hypothetical protein n=1 Tax=Streptomyces lincolnensis TaxID=1915 RepID=UPI0037CDE302